MRAFRPEFVAARASDFIGMIKDCDEAGFPKVRRCDLMFNCLIVLEIRWEVCFLLLSICCLALWVAVWPVPTLQNLRGSRSWMKPGKSSPKSAAPRYSEAHSPGPSVRSDCSRLLIGVWLFFRITWTVLRSGWSSPADTSQWVPAVRAHQSRHSWPSHTLWFLFC